METSEKVTGVRIPEWLKQEIDIVAEQMNEHPAQVIRIAAYAFTRDLEREGQKKRLHWKDEYTRELLQRKEPGTDEGTPEEIHARKFRNLTKTYLDEMVRASGDVEREKEIEQWYNEAKKEIQEERDRRLSK
jgi:hypothetical protein